jgi:hypothetical protein
MGGREGERKRGGGGRVRERRKEERKLTNSLISGNRSA